MIKSGRKRDADDEFEGEYWGNMWGWKFSMISLTLIVAMTGLMAYRALVLKEPIFEELKKEEPTEQVDSLKNNSGK